MGNDGLRYESLPNINGVYSWRKMDRPSPRRPRPRRPSPRVPIPRRPSPRRASPPRRAVPRPRNQTTTEEEYNLPAGTYFLGDASMLRYEVADLWDAKAHQANGLFRFDGRLFACITPPPGTRMHNERGTMFDYSGFTMAHHELVHYAAAGQATLYSHPVKVTATHSTVDGAPHLTLVIRSKGHSPLKLTTYVDAVPFYNLT